MEPKLSSEYDGRPRWLFSKKCSCCEKIFWVPKNQLEKRDNCSKECSGKQNRKRKCVTCAKCGKEFERAINKTTRSKTALQFCTRKCKDDAQRLEGLKALHPPHYGSAPYSKKRLIRERGHSCERCRLTTWLEEPIPLEVHHVDGHANNSSPENLRLLCPNCHALTPTYRGRNKGNGRRSLGLM